MAVLLLSLAVSSVISNGVCTRYRHSVQKPPQLCKYSDRQPSIGRSPQCTQQHAHLLLVWCPRGELVQREDFGDSFGFPQPTIFAAQYDLHVDYIGKRVSGVNIRPQIFCLEDGRKSHRDNRSSIACLSGYIVVLFASLGYRSPRWSCIHLSPNFCHKKQTLCDSYYG